MAEVTTAQHTLLEQQTALYLQKLDQIDRLLCGPVETLIRHVDQFTAKYKTFKLPAHISERVDYSGDHCPTATAISFAAIQRIERLRRRFSWLTKHERLIDFSNNLTAWLRSSEPENVTEKYNMLNSPVFGVLNPLTATLVFRVLVEAGEPHVHCGLGFKALFAMIWSLYRRFPDPLSAGARIEPWEPSAYVTANCLLSLFKVKNATVARAKLLADIRSNFSELAKLCAQEGEQSSWLFNLQLDALHANLNSLSNISVAKDQLSSAADSVINQSLALSVKSDPSGRREAYNCICSKTTVALKQVSDESTSGVEDARTVLLGSWKTELLAFLDKNISATKPTDPYPNAHREVKSNDADVSLKHPDVFKFSGEYAREHKYWEDLKKAASDSFDLCDTLLKLIDHGATKCKSVLDEGTEDKNIQVGDQNQVRKEKHDCCNDYSETIMCDKIGKALKFLQVANRDIAKLFETEALFKDSPRWCRTIMDREIAHASAGNDTEYDSSELVNAIAVAVRSGLISTELQVSDAVSKALLGAHKDGSWKSGLPFYSGDDAQGTWPVTSETVWTLTEAIRQYPDVTVADETLFLYLDWLERTQRNFSRVNDGAPKEKETKPEGTDESKKGQEEQTVRYSGWASERLCHSRKIHLATTAFSINAILDIRDLVEYRFLQLCQKRFTCMSITKGLAEVEPVDLGAKHESRTHGIFAHMVAKTQGPKYKEAAYSWVLHGPPGSSKTKIAESLSAEMWQNTNKWDQKRISFIRITPADFTRMGEDRLDSEARQIFDLISHVRGVTIFFDEIDDLLYRRSIGTSDSNYRPTFMALVVPAMLNRLADLREACPRQEICFLLATNYIENIEPALMRSGRIDKKLPVVYPDHASRSAMLSRALETHLKRLFEISDKSKHDLSTGAAEKPATVTYQSVLEASSEDQLNRLKEKVIAQLPELSEKLHDIVDGTKGWPWSNIKKMFEESIDRIFQPKVLRKFDVTSKVNGEIKAFVNRNFEDVVMLTLATLDSMIQKHFPKVARDIRQADVVIDHYSDRWPRGMKSSEFINEVAHYHFSHDVDVTTDLSELTKEKALRKEFWKLKKRKRIANKLLAVAEEEGRLDRIKALDGEKKKESLPLQNPQVADALAKIDIPGENKASETPKLEVPAK